VADLALLVAMKGWVMAVLAGVVVVEGREHYADVVERK
jgi:hypothetical protein